MKELQELYHYHPQFFDDKVIGKIHTAKNKEDLQERHKLLVDICEGDTHAASHFDHLNFDLILDHSKTYNFPIFFMSYFVNQRWYYAGIDEDDLFRKIDKFRKIKPYLKYKVEFDYYEKALKEFLQLAIRDIYIPRC